MEADHETSGTGLPACPFPDCVRDRPGGLSYMRRSGQASIEFALLYSAVILPLTFMVVFVSEMLWVWHSVVDFTRDGATYAATHCWMGDGGNVTTYMTTHVPRMIDMDKFQSGEAGLQISYFSQDPATGQLTPFACA